MTRLATESSSSPAAANPARTAMIEADRPVEILWRLRRLPRREL